VASFLLRAVREADFPYLKQAPCISSEQGTGWTKDRTEKTQGRAPASVL
jgi:hypothetical protein